tara:strand:- start:308 stop:898 length:591 start_codon:yes stop_codon:yes gene_type:complete
MPSNKTSLYDGCVYLNSTVDSLDLTGDINRTVVATTAVNSLTLRLNTNSESVISVGDKLMKSVTGEYLGKVKSVSSTVVTFEQGIKTSIASGEYVNIYPKFEIVRIDIFGAETYIVELTPVNTKSIGNKSPEHGTWAANTVADFGTQSEDGGVFSLGSLAGGTSIDGRWKRVLIDKTGIASNEQALCYLKATPTIM